MLCNGGGTGGGGGSSSGGGRGGDSDDEAPLRIRLDDAGSFPVLLALMAIHSISYTHAVAATTTTSAGVSLATSLVDWLALSDDAGISNLTHLRAATEPTASVRANAPTGALTRARVAISAWASGVAPERGSRTRFPGPIGGMRLIPPYLVALGYSSLLYDHPTPHTVDLSDVTPATILTVSEALSPSIRDILIRVRDAPWPVEHLVAAAQEAWTAEGSRVRSSGTDSYAKHLSLYHRLISTGRLSRDISFTTPGGRYIGINARAGVAGAALFAATVDRGSGGRELAVRVANAMCDGGAALASADDVRGCQPSAADVAVRSKAFEAACGAGATLAVCAVCGVVAVEGWEGVTSEPTEDVVAAFVPWSRVADGGDGVNSSSSSAAGSGGGADADDGDGGGISDDRLQQRLAAAIAGADAEAARYALRAMAAVQCDLRGVGRVRLFPAGVSGVFDETAAVCRECHVAFDRCRGWRALQTGRAMAGGRDNIDGGDDDADGGVDDDAEAARGVRGATAAVAWEAAVLPRELCPEWTPVRGFDVGSVSCLRRFCLPAALVGERCEGGRLPELSDVEKTLISPVLVQHECYLLLPAGRKHVGVAGASVFARAYRGNVVAFACDGATRLAERLPRRSLADAISVLVVGVEAASEEAVKRAARARIRAVVRPGAVLAWLRVLVAMQHPAMAGVRVGRDVCVGGGEGVSSSSSPSHSSAAAAADGVHRVLAASASAGITDADVEDACEAAIESVQIEVRRPVSAAASGSLSGAARDDDAVALAPVEGVADPHARAIPDGERGRGDLLHGPAVRVDESQDAVDAAIAEAMGTADATAVVGDVSRSGGAANGGVDLEDVRAMLQLPPAERSHLLGNDYEADADREAVAGGDEGAAPGAAEAPVVAVSDRSRPISRIGQMSRLVMLAFPTSFLLASSPRRFPTSTPTNLLAAKLVRRYDGAFADGKILHFLFNDRRQLANLKCSAALVKGGMAKALERILVAGDVGTVRCAVEVVAQEREWARAVADARGRQRTLVTAAMADAARRGLSADACDGVRVATARLAERQHPIPPPPAGDRPTDAQRALAAEIERSLAATTARVPYSASARRSHARCSIALCIAFGLPTLFLTTSPPDRRSRLANELAATAVAARGGVDDGGCAPASRWRRGLLSAGAASTIARTARAQAEAIAASPVAAAVAHAAVSAGVRSLLLGSADARATFGVAGLEERTSATTAVFGNSRSRGGGSELVNKAVSGVGVPGLLGRVVAHSGVVEQQQRGAPHDHVLVWGEVSGRTLTAAATDAALRAAVVAALDATMTTEPPRRTRFRVIGEEQREEEEEEEEGASDGGGDEDAAPGVEYPATVMEHRCTGPHDPVCPVDAAEVCPWCAAVDDAKRLVCHPHSATCAKGKVGVDRCRLSRPTPVCPETRLVRLATRRVREIVECGGGGGGGGVGGGGRRGRPARDCDDACKDGCSRSLSGILRMPGMTTPMHGRPRGPREGRERYVIKPEAMMIVAPSDQRTTDIAPRRSERLQPSFGRVPKYSHTPPTPV